MPIPFFHDIGWFYLSALAALRTGQVPLLGITSSVIWLHQGPLWTYMLIPVIWTPYGGVLISVFWYLVSVILVYFVSRLYFDRKTAQVGSFLWLASPLVFIYSLTPYQTAPIPAFTLLVVLFLARNKYFLAFLFLGFLYQLERISVVLWPSFFWLLYLRNHHFKISNLLAFILGALPLVLSGPVEFFGPFIMPLIHQGTLNLNFYQDLLSKLIFPAFPIIPLILFISSIFYLLAKKSAFHIWLIIPILLVLLSKTGSEAYFIQIFPFLIISIASLLSRYPKIIIFIIFIIFITNIYWLRSKAYMIGLSGYGLSLSQKMDIVKQAGFYPEKLKVIAPGQEFASTPMPYEYLFWYYYRNKTPNSSFIINEFSYVGSHRPGQK